MSKMFYIFTGGEVHAHSMNELSLSLREGDRVIAADSGYLTARRFDIMPDLLLGDLDSLDRAVLTDGELDRLEKLIVPSVKDDTDTQLALDTAIARGAESVCIIGGMGGRLDHTLSSVFLLEYAAKRGVNVTMTDGRNRVRAAIADGETVNVQVEKGYKYLSLVSLSDECENVCISGVFYPLDGVTLTRSYAYAVSNEIVAHHASISFTRGVMLIIESRD